MADWKPFPEDPRERAQFQRGVQMCEGDVRRHIAHALRIWAAVHSGGSYAEQCHIMANEVMKLALPGPAMTEDQAAAVKFYADNPSAALLDFGQRTKRNAGVLGTQAPASLDPALREFMGRMVRMEWERWAREQPSPKPSWLTPWDQLTEPEREVDRRIAEAIWRFNAVPTNGVAIPQTQPKGGA